MPDLTVSDIAEMIVRPGEDIRAAGDRIRNWTKEGLLIPLGEKNPGTGRSRLYPEAAMLEAMVLRELTEAIGLQPLKTRFFARWLTSEESPLPKNGLRGFYLVMGNDDGDEVCARVPVKKILEFLKDAELTSWITIDLGKLVDQLEKKRKK
jgi:hypothetical protein